MGNLLLTPTIITREYLRILHNRSNFIGSINRDYDKRFAQSGAKIGTQLQIRLPNQYTIRRGLVASAQDTTEQSVALVVSSVMGVDFGFNSQELTLTIDEFSSRYIKPSAAVLSSNLEADAFSMYKAVYQQTGVPGTNSTGANVPLHYLQAGALLNQSLTPDDDTRSLIVNSGQMTGGVDALKGLFQSSTEISKQYLRGIIGVTAGFTWMRNELIPAHTMGTAVANAGSVDGANQTGAILNVKGYAAGATITNGTIFTITTGTAVNMVHPETKATYGQAQQFVVTADATCDASGKAALSISPSIVKTGATQNVTASPDDGATITLSAVANSTYHNALAFHKDAFTFVTADLDLPKGMDMASRVQQDGISIAFLRGFDIVNRKYISRLDVLYGYLTTRPQLASRVAGA